MRITNQMITGNSLRNMQKSMNEVNKTTTQLTTGKKISQASEDPVIAIRALKLRTTVNQLQQYKEKNIPDAESWFEISETSLSNITKRIEDIQDYCVQGSTDSFNTTDRGAIIDSLKQLKDMLYGEGNSTYAGRYIFSGYKTDRALTFTETEDTTKYSYDITQHFSPTALDTKNVVLNGVDYDKLDNYLAGTETYNQPDPEMVYRLNLAYEGISETNSAGNNVLSLSAKDKDGNDIDLSAFNVTVKKVNEAATYYAVGPTDINIIEETGEIIFGEDVYNTLKLADDISVSYAKNKVDAGDLRPEHYFDCTQHVVQTDGSVKDINYTATDGKQPIYYEVNFNQSVQVNTEGRDLISENMTNNINDLIYALQDLDAAEKAQVHLKSMLQDVQYASNDAAVEQINRMLSDIDVEIAVRKENLQKTFSANITNFQNYMSQVSAIQSDVGSRMSKLTMISTRVDEQYASFKELKSQNEDVETDAAIIDFNEAELVYQSALAATSNIMTKTLLDYL
ncbi:MAG: flagellar hook-associated protein FlgL [Wujia sp.]